MVSNALDEKCSSFSLNSSVTLDSSMPPNFDRYDHVQENRELSSTTGDEMRDRWKAINRLTSSSSTQHLLSP